MLVVCCWLVGCVVCCLRLGLDWTDYEWKMDCGVEFPVAVSGSELLCGVAE